RRASPSSCGCSPRPGCSSAAARATTSSTGWGPSSSPPWHRASRRSSKTGWLFAQSVDPIASRVHSAGMGLLRDRNFRVSFAGQGSSRLGDGLYTAAVAWLAWSLTHAPGAVALVTVAAYAPTFLATLIGASYADRYDRRRLMIATDLVRAAVVALAPLLLAAGRLNLTMLVAS